MVMGGMCQITLCCAWGLHSRRTISANGDPVHCQKHLQWAHEHQNWTWSSGRSPPCSAGGLAFHVEVNLTCSTYLNIVHPRYTPSWQ